MNGTNAPQGPTKLIRAGDLHIAISAGGLKYLVRHSFRERIFEFKTPYPDEWEQFEGTLPELIATALDLCWFRPATPLETVTHSAEIAHLKQVLTAAGCKVKAKSKRAELLANCLALGPEWMEEFARLRPAYLPLDKGRIELQSTRPVVVVETRESRLQQLRGYFDGDLNTARQAPYILGIKIWARTDLHWAVDPCPLAGRYVGVFLPNDVPELYPDDCPDEYSCSCLLREMVFDTDTTPEADELRAKLEAIK